ncbi:MAG: hypothetical protein IT198_04115 [Acidimicrobiia bacterium]|nr:hypothetical protein [Acidimicrobiia bacterium]
MRFFVAGWFDTAVALEEERVEDYATSMEMLRKWHEEGVVQSFEFFSDRLGGMAIFEVADVDELQRLLDLVPLVDEDAFALSMAELFDLHDDERTTAEIVHEIVTRQLGS